jgi:hypothetical protein
VKVALFVFGQAAIEIAIVGSEDEGDYLDGYVMRQKGVVTAR